MFRSIFLLTALSGASVAQASTIQATPATFAAVLKQARSGDTIKLSPGDYGHVSIVRRNFPSRVVIDAADARMTLSINQSSGLHFHGGTFGPADDKITLGYAARVVRSTDVTFLRSAFIDSKRAIVIDRSQDVTVNHARMTGMTIDGINIASSQRVNVTNSICEKFNTGKAHPDCIQLWSRPATGITSDVMIYKNRSIGNMQGFTGFNHVRKGIDDGGFDRIFVMKNYVEGTYPQGINLTDCRKCVVRDNEVATVPGSKWRTSINVKGGSVLQQDNIVGRKR